jgi:hypothetical protein
MLSPSSGSKNKSSLKPACNRKQVDLRAGVLHNLSFDPEDGGDMVTFKGTLCP